MLDRANDLITYRIDAVLDEIATMSLCDLPDDEPITPDEFLHNTEVNLKKENKNLFFFIIEFM
jgi:dynein heavy chain